MIEDFEKALLFLYAQAGNVTGREQQIKILAGICDWDLKRSEAAFVEANKRGYSHMGHGPDCPNCQ